MEKILNYIDGKFQAPQAGAFLDNENPARGKVYSLVPDCDEKDLAQAVQAAQKAFPAWSQKTPRERGDWLLKLSQKITEKIESLALAESIDNGKPLSLCRNLDIPRASLNFKFFADLVPQFEGETFSREQNTLNFTTYSPLGVVACISPWNLPLYSLTWKIAPALAAGNTVIAKPSELTPMTAFLLAKILEEVGFPPGVLNILHGAGAKIGAALVKHPQVKAISFTGSTVTGRTINGLAASSFKKVSLEMGGKNANIIFADADLQKALQTTVRSSFLNQGQICLCGSRIFVEKSIYHSFRDQLVALTKKLRLGNPLDASTDQGALVSRAHQKKVLSSIELAQQEGGKILCGGKAASVSGENAEGYFVEPTLIENLPFTCRTNQEEIFGPVATLIPFESEDDVVTMANGTAYGLSASIWTQNEDRGRRIASRLEAGIVWLNTWMSRDLRTPFGGVKESGLGREGGFEALAFFSEVKTICLALPPEEIR